MQKKKLINNYNIKKGDSIEIIINKASLFYYHNKKLLFAFKQGISFELNVKNPYEFQNFGFRKAFENGRSFKKKYNITNYKLEL